MKLPKEIHLDTAFQILRQRLHTVDECQPDEIGVSQLTITEHKSRKKKFFIASLKIIRLCGEGKCNYDEGCRRGSRKYHHYH
jgi:hypothetical protein